MVDLLGVVARQWSQALCALPQAVWLRRSGTISNTAPFTSRAAPTCDLPCVPFYVPTTTPTQHPNAKKPSPPNCCVTCSSQHLRAQDATRQVQKLRWQSHLRLRPRQNWKQIHPFGICHGTLPPEHLLHTNNATRPLDIRSIPHLHPPASVGMDQQHEPGHDQHRLLLRSRPVEPPQHQRCRSPTPKHPLQWLPNPNPNLKATPGTLTGSMVLGNHSRDGFGVTEATRNRQTTTSSTSTLHYNTKGASNRGTRV
jgi:hypothetical protein